MVGGKRWRRWIAAAGGAAVVALLSSSAVPGLAGAVGTARRSSPVVARSSTSPVVEKSSTFSSLATPTRIYGQTADATAAKELEHQFTGAAGHCPGTTQDRSVVLATDATYPDALASAYLARYLGSGTLLTPTRTLSPPTTTALRLEGITHVYVVGGPLAVSTAVVDEIEALPAYQCGGTTTLSGTFVQVTRIWGQTQYTTAQDVATFVPAADDGSLSFASAYAGVDATGGDGKYNTTAGLGSSAPSTSGLLRTAIVVTGRGFQDAEAASTLAYADELPILLTTPSSLSAQASSAIAALGVKQVVLMGGQLAVSNSVVSALESLGVSVLRIAGQNYTATAVELAQFETSPAGTGLGWTGTGGLTVARGDFYTDGLAGALVAADGPGASAPEPLLLTLDPTTVGTALGAFLRTAGMTGIGGAKVTRLTILGGPLALSQTAVNAMTEDLSGSLRTGAGGATANHIVAKSNTLVLPSSRAVSVTGSPTGIQTTVLTTGTAPVVGGYLVLPVSTSAPDGLLGKVTAVHTNANGTVSVTTLPATLTDAYSAFTVHMDFTAGRSFVPEFHQGIAHGTADSTLMSPATSLSHLPFTCSGSATPTITVSATLMALHGIITLDIYAPEIIVTLSGVPHFSATVDFKGEVTCKLKGTFKISIPLVEPLQLTLRPVFQLDAQGAIGLHFTWKPRITIGFSRGNRYKNTTTFLMHGAPTITPTGAASASAFFAITAELSLAGRVGVGLDFGPLLSATLANSCLTISIALKSDLTARVTVFVITWHFKLLGGVFDKTNIYRACSSVPAPLTITSTSLPNGVVGEAYSVSLAASGGQSPYTWAVASGSLPTGLTLASTGLLSGTPTKAGTSTVTLEVTDAAGTSATKGFSIVVTASSGTGSPGTGGGSKVAGAVSVASDGSGYCAVLSTSSVECWGTGYDGALGDGSTASSNVPVAVVGITDATRLASDGSSYCAILSTGGVECWGPGYYGELGDGSTASSNVPVAVVGISNAISVASIAGYNTTYSGGGYCAVLSSGSVECWGYGRYGQLGDGSTASSNVPVAVVGISNAISVTSSLLSYCAVLSTGSVECWGTNSYGGLGDGALNFTTTSSNVPVRVIGISNATRLYGAFLGRAYCAVLSTPTQSDVCWGFIDDLRFSSPEPVLYIRNETSFAFTSSVCALVVTGRVYCWGVGDSGTIGIGISSVSANGPSTPVIGVANATSVIGDGDGYCAVLSTGGVECWGSGTVGQLGDGSTSFESSVPVAVESISNATSVTGDGDGYCAVLSTGGVECWGTGFLGQLGDGSTASSNVPVVVKGIGT